MQVLQFHYARSMTEGFGKEVVIGSRGNTPDVYYASGFTLRRLLALPFFTQCAIALEAGGVLYVHPARILACGRRMARRRRDSGFEEGGEMHGDAAYKKITA
jgi:hypothetical protein